MFQMEGGTCANARKQETNPQVEINEQIPGTERSSIQLESRVLRAGKRVIENPR